MKPFTPIALNKLGRLLTDRSGKIIAIDESGVRLRFDNGQLALIDCFGRVTWLGVL